MNKLATNDLEGLDEAGKRTEELPAFLNTEEAARREGLDEAGKRTEELPAFLRTK